MTSILLEGFEPINLDIKDAEQKSIITRVSWGDYEQLLNRLGNSLRYRITYLDGTLEIMSPSRLHEVSKKNIARLLEAYLDQIEIDYWGLGSTTFRKQNQQSGKERQKPAPTKGARESLPRRQMNATVLVQKKNSLILLLKLLLLVVV